MLRKTFVVGVLSLLLLGAPTQARERGQDDLRQDMEFARQRVFPALVNISVVMERHGGGRSRRTAGAGSGVIVSVAGHVITNYHVAEHAKRITCRLPSKETIDADVVAHDPLTDLTVLKLRMNTRKDPNIPLPYALIGNSDDLRAGDYVLAMGNPQSLSSSMTLGIIGNPERVMTSFTGSSMQNMELPDGQLTGIFTRWIQHDALILGGNSGGPLVNLKGEVIGINELGGSGVGFAIPSNLVRYVLNQALTHGTVIRGWFGLTLFPVEKMGLDHGALVSSVEPGGPAAKAGVQPGDLLLSLDGEPTDAVFFEEVPLLYKRFADYKPGAAAALEFLRGEEKRETTLDVVLMERYLADNQVVRNLGVTARDITGPMALIRRYPSSDGVLISGVRPGLPADKAKPKLRSGDVIVELAGKPVKDFEAMEKILAKIGRKEDVLVRVRRVEQDFVTVVDLSKPDKPSAGGELPKAWIGIRTQVLTPDVAKALSLGKTRGYRITQVYRSTMAEKAGLAVGDVITALNGDALHAWRVQDAEILTRRVEDLTIGETAKLTILREGGERVIEVELQETPGTAAEADTTEDSVLEYKVRAITFKDLISRRLPMDQEGVLVTDVSPGGWANLAGLRVGDLILKIAGRDVKSVKDFKKVVKSIAKDKPKVVMIFVVRAYRTAFVFVQPD